MFNDPVIISALVSTIGAIIIVLISNVSTLFIKRRFDQQDRKKVHDVAKQAISDSRLEKILHEIKDLTNFPRISVWVYSNGGYFYTGQAMQHLSMIAESTHIDHAPIKDKNQRVPIHMFARNLSKLLTSTDGIFQEYNELQYNDALSKINSENDIVSLAMFRIVNKENKDIGFLMLGSSKHTSLDNGALELIKGLLPTIKYEIEGR